MKQAILGLIRWMGYDIVKAMPVASPRPSSFPPNPYNQDSLFTTHNHDFMVDADFKRAYDRGVMACGQDYGIHWRVHVALWCAACAVRLDGDFVECGVNRGFLSSAIMEYVNWTSLSRRFFLFDTFRGLDERFVSEDEKEKGRLEFSRMTYAECFEEVSAYFSEFQRVELIRGSVPDTLGIPNIKGVSYLSIDMNNAAPEIAAADFFWDKLVPGAVVLLDDYAYVGYDDQKQAFDQFAVARSVRILSLPTGQGLIVKP